MLAQYLQVPVGNFIISHTSTLEALTSMDKNTHGCAIPTGFQMDVPTGTCGFVHLLPLSDTEGSQVPSFVSANSMQFTQY